MFAVCNPIHDGMVDAADDELLPFLERDLREGRVGRGELDAAAALEEVLHREIAIDLGRQAALLCAVAASSDESQKAALAMAVDDSEVGQVMRQASPFADVLTEDERSAFLASWSDDAAAR